MTDAVIHLRLRPHRYLDHIAFTPCMSAPTPRWTDEVQAVTCPKCIAKMELQPA